MTPSPPSLSLLCAITCALTQALAQAKLSFNLGVVSLYKWNGLGLSHDMGNDLTVGASVSGTPKKDQLGGAGDNRLVFSLVKGF